MIVHLIVVEYAVLSITIGVIYNYQVLYLSWCYLLLKLGYSLSCLDSKLYWKNEVWKMLIICSAFDHRRVTFCFRCCRARRNLKPLPGLSLWAIWTFWWALIYEYSMILHEKNVFFIGSIERPKVLEAERPIGLAQNFFPYNQLQVSSILQPFE